MATVAFNSTQGRWIMASTILPSAMAFIDGTALNVVLPSLQEQLHAQATDLFWILNAYLLMLAAFILPGGSLGDKLGRKKIFITGIIIFLAGSAACGFAPGVTWLIIFRVLQGLGGAFMIPGSLAIISASFNAKEKGKAIGTWSAATTMVTIGGPLLGGALADAGLWRYIFFINVPIGVVSLLILFFKVKESTDEDADHTIDYFGAIAIVLGLALITFGFLRMPAVGLHNWQVITSLASGVIILLAFIVIEKKSKHAMMPLKLFNNKTFSGANLLTFFLYAGLGAGMLFLSLNMVQVQGYSQLQSGLTFIPFTLLMIMFARFSGSLTDKYGPRLLLIAGPATAGVGLLALSFIKLTKGPSAYFTTFFPGILLFGLGMSFTVAPLTTTVMGSVDAAYSGTASGINNAMTRISNVFANAIFGALAVLFFAGALENNLQKLKLNPSQHKAVIEQAANLGDAKVPAAVDAKNKNEVALVYKQSFVNAYNNIMRIAAALAFSGALMSFLFIKNKAVKDAPQAKTA